MKIQRIETLVCHARMRNWVFVKVVTDGTTADLSCPDALTGVAGHKFVCDGETSDGHIIDVAIIERGGGQYRWEIVASRPMR